MCAPAGTTQSSFSTAKPRNSAAVRVWDLLRPSHAACIASLSVHDGGCTSLLAMPSGEHLVSGGVKGDIAVICCRSWRPIITHQAHKATIKALAVAPPAAGSERFVTGGADGDVKVWDLEGLLGSEDVSYEGPAACVQHVPDCHDTSVYHETLGRCTHLRKCGRVSCIVWRRIARPSAPAPRACWAPLT